MYKENIELVENLSKQQGSIYGTLSFLSDTFEAMKTYSFQKKVSPEQRKNFEESVAVLCGGMRRLDDFLDSLKG